MAAFRLLAVGSAMAGCVILGLAFEIENSHRSSHGVQRLRVTDTSGHLLPSLFVNARRDPHFSLAAYSTVRTCSGKVYHFESKWETAKRYLSLFGLAETTVHAQGIYCAGCGGEITDWPCAENCGGTYFGGEGTPSNNPYIGITVTNELDCYKANDWQCPGVGQTARCGCNGEDPP
jgi:hypothetical protein